LLDVSRIGPLGTFSLGPAGATTPPAERGGTTAVPFAVGRSETFFERVQLSITSLPAGWTGALAKSSLIGWTATAGQVNVTVPKDTPLGRYTIGLRGTNQGRAAEATIAVNVTEDDPTASAPGTTFITGTRIGLTSTKIHVRWPAATDPSSAITRYELQRSVNGGPWGTTRSLAGTTRTITDTVAFDVTYRYRLRAADAAGHWSPWAVAGTSRVHAYDDRSSRVAWAGPWKRVTSWLAFKRTVTGSTKPWATMSKTFTGHSVAIVGPKGRHRGKFTVSIDGKVVKTVSQKSSASSRRVVFAWYSAAGGTHTITIRPTGTGTYRLIRVDAILVGR
jgi:hypothetical protein